MAVYREWGRGRERGVAFFLGGGLLEVSGTSVGPASGAVRLFLQVRDLRAVRERLAARGVPVEEDPTVRPWGLFEMVARDPDGLALQAFRYLKRPSLLPEDVASSRRFAFLPRPVSAEDPAPRAATATTAARR